MKWDELRPLEKNVLVSEVVFGITFERKGNGYPHTDIPVVAENDCPVCGYDGAWDSRNIPEFQTQMHYAWKVIEEMGKKETDIREFFRNSLETVEIFHLTPDMICRIAVETMEKHTP